MGIGWNLPAELVDAIDQSGEALAVRLLDLAIGQNAQRGAGVGGVQG
jgi:hypothetical protein